MSQTSTQSSEKCKASSQSQALIAAGRHKGKWLARNPLLQVQQLVDWVPSTFEPSPETFESGSLGSATMRTFLKPKAPRFGFVSHNKWREFKCLNNDCATQSVFSRNASSHHVTEKGSICAVSSTAQPCESSVSFQVPCEPEST